MSYQTTIIVGNVGRDPEMRYTPTGASVTNFSVAVNESFTDSNGEKVKRTIWFRVSAWGRQAETCNQYLRKGSSVLVEGRLVADPATGNPRTWESNGEARAQFEITAQTVRFLSNNRQEQEQDAGDMLPDERELPF